MRSLISTAGVVRWVLVIAVGLLSLVSQVRADDSKDYEALIRSALQEYDAGRYDEAGALFRRAHELSPNARTYRGLGLTYYESRKYALAVEHLRAALDDTRRPLTAAQRDGTQKILDQAEGFVARVTVLLEPSDATLEVDGYAAQLKGTQLLLDAGSHELIARAPSHMEEHRRVDAIAGSATEVRIALNPEPTQVASGPTPQETAAQAATSEPPPVAESSGGPGIGPYIVLGAGGALLIGSLVTGLMAQSLHSDLEKRCPDDKCKASDTEAADDKKTGRTLVAETNVLLTAGLVAAAAGATWWILAPRDESQPQVAAVCAPSGCMAALNARF
jgi:hypothetical protein